MRAVVEVGTRDKRLAQVLPLIRKMPGLAPLRRIRPGIYGIAFCSEPYESRIIAVVDAVQGLDEERRKVYLCGTALSTGVENDEMRRHGDDAYYTVTLIPGPMVVAMVIALT